MNEIDKLNADYKEIASKGSEYEKAEFIATSIPIFDAVTGGGFARGHMTEVHGLEGSGKTTLCIQGVASAQKQGLTCVWVDGERRFNPERAAELGVQLEDLIIIRPKYGEQATAAMLDILERGKVDLMILDSLPSLAPRSEIEASETSGPIGGQARMWATFIRKMIIPLSESRTAFVVVNQMRANIMANPYGPEAHEPYTYPGGKSQKYHASTRLEVKKGKTYKEGELPKGFYTRFRNVKTSFVQPYLAAETILYWDSGFSTQGDLVEEALEKGIITKKGNSFFFGEEKIAVGQAKLREALKDSVFAEKITNALS